MKIATEHFYDEYEFQVRYQLCNSDCESLEVAELLELAGLSLADLGRLHLGYTEAKGNPELRAALADSYATARAEDVLVLGTPVEGIYLGARAVLDPQDEVIVLTPAYDALINMFEHVVGPERVKKWALTPTDTRWTLDFDELETLISPRTKLVVVNFPHNPTGFLPDPAQLDQLISIIEKHNLWLFCDEMYFGLVHSGTPPIPSVADLTQRAVVLSGLSKTYGLPGLRTGWLVIQDQDLRDNILNWKFYTSICPPAPSEFLALAAWRMREQLRDRSVAQIEQNLAFVEPFFARWPELFTWRPPLAGSTALVGMNVPSVTAYAHEMAQSAGILIHPGPLLGADDHHFRLGLGRAKFGEALVQFETYLNR